MQRNKMNKISVKGEVERMKACQHYKRPFGTETEIVPSDGFGWNAWIGVWDNNRLVYCTFQTGLRWDYLSHLSQSEKCREEVGVSSEEVSCLLKEIEEEWRRVNS
jgi:hypothetical protein